MLVEINLLPQKEPKKISTLIITAVLAVLFLLVAAFYFYQIYTVKTAVTSTETQAASVQKMVARLQKQQGTKNNSAASVIQLKKAIDWVENNRIETIPVMRHLTSLLPERGFIQKFAYQESGTASLTVQFDTALEAANYLNSLNHSSWISNASLASLNTSSDSSSGTSASSGTNSANAVSNSTGTSPVTAADSNTTTSNTSGSGLDEKYLPRYTGTFTIQFNKAAIIKAVERSKKNGNAEGVSGS